MHRWFSLFLVLTLLLIPARANAQTPLVLDSLDVSVRPEYDTPTVLVVYMITLSPNTTLPVDITLSLPASVDKIFTVAVGATQGTVSDQQKIDYKITPGTDYAKISIKATGPAIRLEYYDPGLEKIGNQRQYTYTWPGDYDVNNFRFEFRQPLQSSNLSVDPTLINIGPDDEGLQMSEMKKVLVKQNQKLGFTAKYQRDTDAASTSFLQLQPSAPLNQNPDWLTYLPWILGAVGLVFLLIAAGVYWASGRANRSMVKARKRHSVRKEDQVESDGDSVHCSQCGKRAKPDDRFCRVCGSRIRRSEA